ncbi:hypothetical protein BpHYR1_029714, partial [Brachionus plicatilis]
QLLKNKISYDTFMRVFEYLAIFHLLRNFCDCFLAHFVPEHLFCFSVRNWTDYFFETELPWHWRNDTAALFANTS